MASAVSQADTANCARSCCRVEGRPVVAHAPGCRIVRPVGPGRRDELESVTHRRECLLELSDRRIVQVSPVEFRRATVGEQLAGVLRVDDVRERAGLGEVRRRGLQPQQVGVGRVGERARDPRVHAGLHEVEPFRGPLAGQELMVPVVGVGRQHGRLVRVRPRYHQAGDVGHIGREPGRVERLDVLAGRDEHPGAEMAVPARRPVLEEHAGRTRLDHRHRQLERVPVAVARHRPARQADGLRPGLHHLHHLVAGDRAARPHRVLAAEQLPQPPGTAPGQGVIRCDRAAQPDDVFGAVVAPDPGRALVCLPLALKAPALAAEVAHVNHVFLIWCGRPSRLAWASACGTTTWMDRRSICKFLQFFLKKNIESILWRKFSENWYRAKVYT